MTTTRRRPLLMAAGVAVVVFLLVVAWLGATAYLARGHLVDLRTEVNRLQDDVSNGNTSRLDPGLAAIRKDAHSAHRLTSDPVWWTAAHIPVLSRTFATSRGLAASADDLASNALPPLVDAAAQLTPAKVRRKDGSLDLTRLTAAAAPLARAETAMAAARAGVAALPATGVIGPVADARRQLDRQLGSLAGSLNDAARAAKVGPDMLGAHGTRRYLVLFENPAEARGTGGLPGSYAVIKAENGKLSREKTGSDSDLTDSPTPVVDLGPEFDARWRAASLDRSWRAADKTPHYPWAAEIWQKLWERQSGQRIDGVIAVDPLALGYLLDVTGPIQLSDGEVLGGSNVAQWTLSTEYFKYPNDNNRRKDLLTELAQKSFDRVKDGRGSSANLLRALGRAAGEHRVLLWAGRPAEESVVTGTPLAGTVLDEKGPLAAVVLNNAAGNKLDYYVDRSLSYQVLRCGDGSRTVRASITLRNTAPSTGLPAYVDARSDNRPTTPGQSRTYLTYYATSGAHVTGATVDGKPARITVGLERGHPAYDVDLEIRAGQSRTFVVEYTEPATKEAVTVPVQPLARPMSVSFSNTCS